MEKVLYNTVYNRKKKLLSNGTALVQIEAYMSRRKKYFSTNIYLRPNQWDKKRRQVKNCPNSVELNKQITDFIAKLESIELCKRSSKSEFSLDLLSDYVHGRTTDSFTKFVEHEIIVAGVSQVTKIGFLTTLNIIKLYKSDILFSEINYGLLVDLERFLYSRGLRANTVDKYFRHIKRFVNIAINKDLMEQNSYPFRKFKTKTEAVNREYLTIEELSSMEELLIEATKLHLTIVRDMFLLSCYTGLRFSDLLLLHRENIISQEGKQWICIRMQKTAEIIRIPVYILFGGLGVDIINRYTRNSDDFLFDKIPNSCANRYLKKIASLAGINKRVTFHMGRHTNATLLLYKGVSITTIQKLLGHKRLQTTQIYSKVMDITMINELSFIIW